MTRLYYPLSRLWPDYLRAGLGLAICLGLLLFAVPQSVIFILLAGLGLLLTWLGAATLWRQQIEILLDDTGVTRTGRWGLGKRLVMPWAEVRSVTLRYYSTRRDRSQGWLRLTIAGTGGTLRADSELTGFAHLAGQALAAAERNGVTVDGITRVNAARLHGEAAP
jgi:hypothetical protein